jgi:hypothetical protein
VTASDTAQLLSEAGGGSTSAKKKFDRARSTALSRGKELRVFFLLRSIRPAWPQAGHSPSATFWRTVGFSRDRQSLIVADVPGQERWLRPRKYRAATSAEPDWVVGQLQTENLF